MHMRMHNSCSHAHMHARMHACVQFTSVKFDAFMSLSLPVSSGGGGGVYASVDECLRGFTSQEVLQGKEMWRCPRCKKERAATKKLDIWNAPPVLVVHLKRFKNNRSKISAFVDFPLANWDLSPFVLSFQQQQQEYIAAATAASSSSSSSNSSSPGAGNRKRGSSAAAAAAASSSSFSPTSGAGAGAGEARHKSILGGSGVGGMGGGGIAKPVYDLFAVSNHYGSFGGGHYTAYCQGGSRTVPYRRGSRFSASLPSRRFFSSHLFFFFFFFSFLFL